MFRLALIASVALPALVRAEIDFAKDVRPVLETYCFKCHGGEKAKAGVKLHSAGSAAEIYRDVGTWDKALEELRDESMPPDDKPQPSAEERARVVAWLEKTLNDPDPEAFPRDPGRPFLHRLSKLEYNNTVRDLLGIDSRPADAFPPDGGGGGGFDNNSATLFVPPVLMEKYLAAATKLLAEAKPERVVSTQPSEALSKSDAARKSIADFTTRAFRRPAEAEEVEALTNLFAAADGRGEPFQDAVKFALRAALASPHFLFRVEQSAGTEAHRVNGHELASRLSYFLWATMPDEELFRVAGEGKLHDREVLGAQVRRMLQDQKARAFAENFAGQWLRVHELKTFAQPDANKFPEFTPEVRDSMHAEPIEFFHALLRDDGNALRLLDADYTYANAVLAKYYGLDPVEGAAFPRHCGRCPLSASPSRRADPRFEVEPASPVSEGARTQRVALRDKTRGGVLTMGAVLTVTSYPRRTSPVLRGKWVLEEILGSPPPPPPPQIKSLPDSDKVRDGKSFRQQLEQHRAEANCAGCHKRMDPLGFGLENFDAIGRWRIEAGGQPVDATGEMVTGEKFSGPAEMKALLLKKKDAFARNLAAKMFAYALNRGLEHYDIPTVRHTVQRLGKDDYRISTLIMGIVESYPFQQRRGTAPVATRP